MTMARLGANRGPRRPMRLTLLGLDGLVLKMGAENFSEASVIMSTARDLSFTRLVLFVTMSMCLWLLHRVVW
jgi:hypothetical protein